MDYPVIRKRLKGFLQMLPGVNQVKFVDNAGDSAAPEAAIKSPEDPPFVLVAHGAGGQWEVYAGDFEHPLASFNERQAGCDFASHLAKVMKNAIVLIRESQVCASEAKAQACRYPLSPG